MIPARAHTHTTVYPSIRIKMNIEKSFTFNRVTEYLRTLFIYKEALWKLAVSSTTLLAK